MIDALFGIVIDRHHTVFRYYDSEVFKTVNFRYFIPSMGTWGVYSFLTCICKVFSSFRGSSLNRLSIVSESIPLDLHVHSKMR